MKRFVSMTLALLLAFSLALTVSAAQAVQPRLIYLSDATCTLSFNTSTGAATCTARAATIENLEIQMECKLQRYNNNKWNNAKTWNVSGMECATLNKTWTVPGGYDYRLYVTIKVYDSNGNCIETATRQDTAYLPAS